MDRALLASLRAAAEAGEAADAAFEAADLLAHKDEALDAAGGARYAGEAGIVGGSAPREEVRTGAVPERQQRKEEGGREIVKASPAVRVMAARLGVRLEDVKGTGPDGRVTQQDVQGAVGKQGAGAGQVQAVAAAPAPRPAPTQPLFAPSPERSKIPEVTKVEFGRTRKVMYRAMGDQGHVAHFG
jgi:2-oxoisovalerate dehydrogenase E2 component (dihydrolipoyl transacylase)